MTALESAGLTAIDDSAATAAADGPVWLYVHDFRASGVVRNAIAYARRIAHDRPVTLIAGHDAGFLREAAHDGSFATVTLVDRVARLPRLSAAPRLRQWLSAQPPGVLMSCGNHGHVTAWLATRGLRHVRRIYRISTEVARSGRLRNLWRTGWMKALIRDAERIVLVGSALERRLVFADALAAGRAIPIPNGIDVAAAREKAAAPCPHRWLEDDIPVALAIGRLRPQKNLDLLIEAIGIARSAQRLRLIILGGGSGDERERLAGLADDAGLGDDFLLAVETANVFAWLSRAGVFILPSRWEGSSMALLEALAVGTPTVASRRAGDAVTVLGDGRHGILFDGESGQALAAAILRQIGAGAVLPGDRAADFDIARTADRYAALANTAPPILENYTVAKNLSGLFARNQTPI
jgi:glycosyltransferase involved in cell wall biosynthesis